MSVLKNKRSVSSLEFYHNAIMLRREITMLLLRDFGIKDKVRSVKSPYDLQELHKQRQVIRDEIGALEEELAKCEDEDEAAAEK